MKIYVLGSNAFMKEMVKASVDLRKMGLDGWINKDYEDLVAGKRDDMLEQLEAGERAQVKRDNDYFRVHFKHIQESDAILIVNMEKNGIQNYIGGNCLIEMGQAYVLDKKIFLSHGMPEGLSYNDEIEAMDPICLEGDLENIKKYI